MVRSTPQSPQPTRSELGKRLQRLEKDLKIAERVHRSLIPSNQRRGDLEFACEFTPANHVGGDYASVHFQSDTRVVVGICDVSGHGVASALLASRVNSFVLQQATHVSHPCELVEALNDFVYRTFYEAGLYVTFFCVFIDLDSHTIVSAGCGHPPVLHYVRETDVVRRIVSENPPVGLFEHLSSTCSMLATPFRRGDRLVLYTDGLTESASPDGRLLGVDRLASWCQDNASLSATDFVEGISRRAHDFRAGRPAADDQLLLAICHLDQVQRALGEEGLVMVQEPEEAAPEGRQIIYIPDFLDELKAKMAAEVQ